MRFLYFLSFIVLVYSQYDLESSGYTQNDPTEVKKVAGASPKQQPKDYTANGKLMDDQKPVKLNEGLGLMTGIKTLFGHVVNIPGRTLIGSASSGNLYNTGEINSAVAPKSEISGSQHNTAKRPSYDFLGLNLFKSRKTEQDNRQAQVNIQKGGDMTNIQTNENNIQVTQTNNNNVPPKPSYDFLGFMGNTMGSLFGKQNNNQEQSNFQQGGAQNNYANNVNKVSTIQINNNNGGGNQQPSYDAPKVGTIVQLAPDVLYYQPLPLSDSNNNPVIALPALPNLMLNNLFNIALGKGARNNVKANQQGGVVNTLGNTENGLQQGQYSDSVRPVPSPIYTQQPSYAQYLPQNIFAGNKVDYTGLAQNNQQGQSNTQVGGAQTNVGSNANAINIEQTNQNGGQGSGYPAPQYDSKYAPTYPQQPSYPSYGSGAGYIPQNIFAGNKVDYTGLAQGNNQGQSSVQQGGAQTNVGQNQNAINIGQTNNNGGQGSGYGAPQYDSKYAPTYPQQPSYPSYGSGAGYIPQNIFAGNKVDYTGLAQGNNQGQSSVQQGGAQTNVGQNQNAINIGQTNNNGGQGSGYGAPQYDSKYVPSYPQPNTYVPPVSNYGGAGAPDQIAHILGNKFNMQNLGQTSSQGQENVQVGGAQTNVGSNSNSINLGQTNNNAGQGKGSGYPAPQYDSKYTPSYPQPTYTQQPSYVQYLPQNIFAGNKIDSKELAQNNNQGQSNTQVGGAQTNVGSNANTINVGQTNNNGGGQKTPSYDAKIKKAPEPEPEQAYRRRA